ncbi:alpha/beta hydrolase [Yinghuangia soli]|uniref:Alpha/beta hydrolase n=1 Tax=Yinghuangia soli TaxID=2908204 RepID=A0AA41Q4N5_9ACTN|nr:alpha/beta hydrolase [Yinghuangia soli]MCF2531127.1 alpha/beta hydrolase [Yinghuangia soli]
MSHSGTQSPWLIPELAALVAAAPPSWPLTPDSLPETRRRVHRQMVRAAAPRPVYAVIDRNLPGPAGPIPIRAYKPRRENGLPVLVYAHGGGWVMGGLETHDALCREVAERAGVVVVSVDYRLAPESPFPGPLEDFYAAAQWVAGNATQVGGDSARVAVGGDSAGGNLAGAACLLARDRGERQFAFQWLAYPGLDGASERSSWSTYADGPVVSAANARVMWKMYAGAVDLRHPHLSPLHAADLSGLPPALIVTPQHDHGHDDAAAYAQRLHDSGVRVTFASFDGMCHGFLSFHGQVSGCLDALDECCGHIRKALGPREPGASVDQSGETTPDI